MNMLREFAGGFFKMFLGDMRLTIGILAVVALTVALTRSGSVPPLVAGAILLIGCVVVLVANVASFAKRQRKR